MKKLVYVGLLVANVATFLNGTFHVPIATFITSEPNDHLEEEEEEREKKRKGKHEYHQVPHKNKKKKHKKNK